jgi:hypothetical protein
MSEPIWTATADPPNCAEWLSEQVRQAVTEFVQDGFLCFDEKEMMFHFVVAVPLDDVVFKTSFDDALTDWFIESHSNGREISQDNTEAIQWGIAIRNMLLAAARRIDDALPKPEEQK